MILGINLVDDNHWSYKIFNYLMLFVLGVGSIGMFLTKLIEVLG
ncbi:hypothetical protein LCGC14_2657960 [marine sediment metagenome]|uniref:Uncharacterized protein n=1 Tax=marine sediment metagenome TaxID=412755 RepID=A0A0F9C392_9ZZZZ